MKQNHARLLEHLRANPAAGVLRHRAAGLVPASVSTTDGHLELEIVFSTGEGVRVEPYQPPFYPEPFIEELAMGPENVDLGRYNDGAAVLDSHRRETWSDQVGATKPGSASVDGTRGLVTLRFSNRAELEGFREDVAAGILRNWSPGYRVRKYRDVTGPDDEIPRLLAVLWEPSEISLASVQADAGAQSRAAAPTHSCVLETQKRAQPMDPELETTVPAETTPAPATEPESEPAAAALEPETEPEAEPAAASGEPAAATRSAIQLQERRRIEGIATLCRSHGLEEELVSDSSGETTLPAMLTRTGATLPRARTVVLEHLGRRTAGAPTSTRVRVGQDRERSGVGAAIENALCHRLQLNTRSEDGTVAPIALTDQGRNYRHKALLEIGRDLLRLRGEPNVDRLSRGDLAERVLEGASRAVDRQRAEPGMMGTDDFPTILGNVANKVLLDAYDEGEATYQNVGRRRDFQDFKPRTLGRMGNVPKLLALAEHGEILAGVMGSESESLVLKTYARTVAFSRQAMINDDLGALEDIPRDFGSEAKVLENELAWFLITSNVVMGDAVALFNAAHSNTAAGVLDGGTVGEASLSAMRTALRRQIGVPRTDNLGNILEAGRKLNLAPGVLCVPPELETFAKKQIAATNPASTGEVNTFGGGMDLLIDAELTDVNDWFVVARRRPGFEYGYLDGATGPRVSTRAGWTSDGLEWRTIHDFTVGVPDARHWYGALNA